MEAIQLYTIILTHKREYLKTERRRIMFREDENTVFFSNKGDNTKLKDFLSDRGISGRMLRKLLKDRQVFMDEKPCKGNEIVLAGKNVWLRMEDEESDMEAEKTSFGIVYEDLDLLVVDKDPLILVHPTPNHPRGTLSNAVAWYFMEKKIRKKIRIINRLDRDTSGVMIFAKNPFGHQQLANQLDLGTLEKTYLAVVQGNVAKDSGEIDRGIRKQHDGIRQEVSEDGLSALTRYRVVERFKEGTLLEVEILSGRTHQIRVHLESIGHPIIGDHLYGTRSPLIERQALHAYSLEFNSPRTGERISVKAEIHQDMQKLLANLRKA